VPEQQARAAAAQLELGEDAVTAFPEQPDPTIYRFHEALTVYGPTIYRFHEALTVYGPTIKELIHEEFGDGILSAINFRLDVSRRADPGGDRVVVTFDGKFLDYQW